MPKAVVIELKIKWSQHKHSTSSILDHMTEIVLFLDQMTELVLFLDQMTELVLYLIT